MTTKAERAKKTADIEIALEKAFNEYKNALEDFGKAVADVIDNHSDKLDELKKNAKDLIMEAEVRGV